MDSYFETESDTAFFVRKIIKEEQEELLMYKEAIAVLSYAEFPEDFDGLVKNYYELENSISFRKMMLRKDRLKRMRINKALLKILNINDIAHLRQIGAIHYEELRSDHLYCDKVINKIYDFLVQENITKKEKKILQEKIRLEFNASFKNIYTCLPIDYAPTADYYVLQQTPDEDFKLKQMYKKSFDEIIEEFKKMPPPIYHFEMEEPIKDPILVQRLVLILKSFGDLRKRIPYAINVNRQNFSSVKNNVWEYIRKFYEVIEDKPIEGEGFEEDIVFDDIPEYRTMVEDPKKLVYDPTIGALASLELGVEPQMDKEGKEGDCNLITEDQKQNVILTSHAEESVAKPVTIGVDNWEKLCSSQAYQAYDIMQRWQKYKVFKWSKDTMQNKIIFDTVLPKDFIVKNINSPSCILFKTYSYCRFDLEVKIQVNSNKFHCGQLQASFYYGGTTDKYYNDRKNIACASQMTHCVIDAASASDGILYIPYRYYKPLLATRKVSDDDVLLDLGNLRIMVLNQLHLPANDTTQIDVTVFIRFVEPRFHGMIARDLGNFVEDQMFSMGTLKKVIHGTEHLLNEVFPDDNRDNPTDPNPTKFVTPLNATSWCHGDMVSEQLNTLRFQATGNTPHPPGTIPKEPEMDISYLVSIYGLVKTIKWSTSDQSGKILLQIPFSPILSTEDYFSLDIKNGEARNCQVMPPVGIMAEMFAYWRGSLDYRIDFISTQFHTGRILVAYVPRIDALATPTLDQLTAGDHIILDLRSNKQYQFINRFLSDKPWWPRRRTDKAATESYPPGHIYFVVLNALTATATVSPDIEFNLYMRGASDFELHIPVAPHIGLSYNTTVKGGGSSTITYVSNYGPPQESIYVGSWHTISDIAGFSVAMFRYGPGSDHVSQFNVPKAKVGTVYRIVGDSKDIVFIDKTGATVGATYMVLIPPVYAISATQYWYGAAFNSPNVAIAFAKTIKKDPKNPGYYLVDFKKIGVTSADGPYSLRTDVIYWESIEHIEDQMEDERKFVCGEQVSVHPPLTSTWNGLLTFGEQITSVKQLIRRYQPYCAVQLQRSTMVPSLADVKIPLLPQGCDLDLLDDYANQARDGLIPILLSGYRFYRGGMRMRIIVSDNAKNSSKHIWVQHKPDEVLDTLKPIQTLNASNANNRMTSGYASYIQNLDTNSVVSIEIPFYLPVQFGLLQRPDIRKKQDSSHYSLGNLYVGIDYGSASGTVNLTPTLVSFYSLSDDFRASVFQGFPPVFRLTEFMPTVESQMNSDPKPSTSTAEPVVEHEEKKEEGKSWWNPMSWREKMEDSITEKAAELVDKKKEYFTSKLMGDVNFGDFISKLTETMDEGRKLVVVAAISNVFHAILSPTLVTIAWSIASFFVTIGAISYSVISSAFSYLKDIVKKLFSKPQNKTDTSGQVESQGPDLEGTSDAAFVSTCVVGALALLKAKEKPIPSDIPNFATYLYEGMPKFTLTANGLFTFFKNNLIMFKKIFYWVISFVRPEATLYAEIDNSSEEILAYIKKMLWCLDASNESKVQTELDSQLQVYLCANVAQILLAKMAVSSIQKPMPVFTRLLYNIIKLRDKLAREFASPPVRYEPFVIGLIGPSKVGKSHMINRLSDNLIQSIGYKSYEELIYVRTPGNAYWNNLRNQPICVYDDFLCLQDQTFGLMQVAELFCLKSTATFNPAKAAIEEKNIRYNPLIVFLCSNVSHPVIQGVACNEALWRRRDLLIHVQAKTEYIGKDPRVLDKTITKDYGHLEFRVYKDSTKDAFIVENGAVKVYTFGEISSLLIKNHLNYHEQECMTYQKRLSQLEKHFPDGIDNKVSIADSLDTLKEWADKTFGEEVDAKKILNKSKFGGSVDPIQKLIDQKKTEAVQEVGIVYGTITANAAKKEIDDQKKLILDLQAQIEDQKKQAAQQEEQLRQMLDDVVVSQMETLTVPTCDCVNQFPEMTNNLTDGNVVVICDTGDYVLGNCGEDCVFNMADFEEVKKAYAKAIKQYWITKKRPLDRLPPNIQILSDCTKTAQTVEDDLLLEIEASKSWYNKWLDKVPAFSTVLFFLAKLLALIGGIWAVVRSVSSLLNIGKECNTENNHAEAAYQLSEAAAFDATQVNTTIVKLWNEDTKSMEKSVRNMFNCNSQDQMPSSGTSNTPGKPKINSAPVKNFIVGQIENEVHSTVYSKIMRNTFWLRLESANDSGIISGVNMRCIGLCGRRFMVIDHYVEFIRQKMALGYSKLFYLAANSCIPLEFSNLDFVCSKNSAILVGKMPLNIPSFYNIVKFICSSTVHQNLGPTAVLIEPTYDTKTNGLQMNCHNFMRITAQDRLVVNNESGSTTSVDRVYVYPKSKKGLCGSILVSTSSINSPIIGIHIAGVRDGLSGYSESLSFETFSTFIAEASSQSFKIDGQMSYEGGKMLPDTNVKYIGVVPAELEASPPRRTRLVQTECYNKITQSNMEPPVLIHTDPRIANDPYSPLFEGIRYHGCPPLDFPQKELYNAYNDLRDQVLTNVLPQRMTIGVLDIESSIMGIKGSTMYQKLDMKTSEGFPFSSMRPPKATSKAWLFDIDEDENLLSVNDSLLRYMDVKQKQRESNVIPSTIFTACLKDAKLPKDKVLIPGKTRIFSISPVDFTIQQRQYFMDFSVAYQEARFSMEHAVGIDIKSGEATELVNVLLNNSDLLITGDYSKFGDQLMSTCVYYVYQIISDWYLYNGDSNILNKNIRMVFCEEVMHARILAINTVYQCYCGMPSGNPLTVVINSMVNSLYTRVVWQLIMKEKDTSYYPLSKFHENTKRIFYGDDLIMSVKEEVVELYNTATMSEMFARYNIKFTDSSKKKEIVKYCNIFDESATFLKHSFYPHPKRYGLWVAKLDDMAANEICNWTWNINKDLRGNSIVACLSMMEELYGHGEEYYTLIRNKTINFWREQLVDIKIPTWYEMDIRIFGI